MHADIERRLLALEERKNALIQRVKDLPPSKQDAAPKPGEMSPAGVIAHMAITEKTFSGFMHLHPPSELRGVKPKPGFLFNWVLRKQRTPLKRIPTAPAALPKGITLVTDAEHEWNLHRREVARMLGTMTDPSEAPSKLAALIGTISGKALLNPREAHMTYHEKFFPNP